MKTIITFLIVSLVILCVQSCNPTEPEKPKLEITIEDVSCNEAWINVTGETGSEVILNRDDKEIKKFILASSPQTIYDDSLLPNKTYAYNALNTSSQELSSKISVTTLDTTSSNFTWQTFTFGGTAGGSIINDCAVISEDNI